MTSIAFHSPIQSRRRVGRRLPGWIAIRLRFHRRARFRRAMLASVLAATGSRQLIEEAGFQVPGPGLLDLWAQTFLQHTR